MKQYYERFERIVTEKINNLLIKEKSIEQSVIILKEKIEKYKNQSIKVAHNNSKSFKV